MRQTQCLRLALVAVLLASACTNTNQPSSPALVVTSITPNTGSPTGGTTVTITGGNFVAGLQVTLGGVPATNVSVVSSSSLTAVTGAHTAGIVDVVVSGNGRSATLGNGFTYAANRVVNTPPIISSLVARGTRPNEPAQFADLSESINVVATVQDAETPVSQLTYEWTSSLGVFTGSGSSVTWRAPLATNTPSTATLTLTVVERYATVDSNGLPITAENRVSRSTTVSVHQSATEVGVMARQFLLDFSDSNIRDVNYIMRNFSDLCPVGKANETQDVTFNRQHHRITSYDVGQAIVTVQFEGVCPFRFRNADACAQVPVDWMDIFLDNGSTQHVVGIDQVTAVYDGARTQWGLCESDFQGKPSLQELRGFIR